MNRLHSSLLIFTMIALAPFTVRADTSGMDGHKLLEKCQAAVQYMNNNEATKDIESVRDCDDYLMGFRETENIKKIYVRGHYSTGYCFPNSGVSNGEAARLVVNYLKTHEQQLDASARDLVRDAFIESYPCRN